MDGHWRRSEGINERMRREGKEQRHRIIVTNHKISPKFSSTCSCNNTRVNQKFCNILECVCNIYHITEAVEVMHGTLCSW